MNVKTKNFFNENEYDKLHPSGSALAHVYGIPRLQKFLELLKLN